MRVSLSIRLDINDTAAAMKANRKFELRVFNADGVPAQRILVPFTDIGWA